MADKHKRSIARQVVSMMEQVRKGTETTHQIIERSNARIRHSLELLKREAPKPWRAEPPEEG